MFARELTVAREAADQAARILRRHFERGVEPRVKAGGEAVSVADLEADAAIVAVLRSAFPEDGLLTEESEDDLRRLRSHRVWICDPLDGTLDFLSGSRDFAVHVALALDGVPVVAVVADPMGEAAWCAVRGQGAFKVEGGGTPSPIRHARPAGAPLRVAISRLRPSEALERMLERLPPHERIHRGSSGLKAALVAEGAADVYFAATSRMREWDLCAPQLIVEEAGGVMTDLFGRPLIYNRPDVRMRSGLLATGAEIHAGVRKSLEPVARTFSWFRDA